MASLQKTYSGDLTEAVVNQLLSARGMASDAKKNAMDVAKAYGVDPMLRGGEFFSRALQTKATAGLPRRFQRQMPSVTMGDPSFLARGQATPFSSGINPKPTNAQTMNRLAGQPFPWLAVGSSLKNQNQRPATTQALTKAANKPTTNTSTRTQGVKVTDEKLGSFIAAVALSLTSSIDSINKKMDETSEGVIIAKEGIADTHKKLEDNTDTVSDKLDKIIEALRFRNQLTKKNADKRETQVKESKEDKRRSVSDANRIAKTNMDRADIRGMQQLDIFEQDGVIRNTPMIPDPWDTPSMGMGMPFAGEFERGGIASGPDSGYLAVLHGDEAIVPLDNNHTQGQPSAIANESVGDMPFLPRAETGMSAGGIKPGDNSSSIMPRMRRGGGKSSSSMFGGDKLAKAMELPAKAAGMVTMGLLGNVLKSVPLIGSVVSGIKLLSEPVAKMFGVPDQVGSGIAEDVANQQKQEASRKEFTSRTRGKEGRERGILGKLKEFFFGEGGGTRVAHSSRVVHKGGTGGYGNRGGGTRIAWGKKNTFNPSSRSEVPAIKLRTMTTDEHMVEADMLSPEKFEKKWNIPYETWKKLEMYSDQSSNFFQTSGTSMNAFNSPEVNQSFTANHVNQESINDEARQLMASANVEPIIINQSSGSSQPDNEPEFSAIASSATPFKDWMYTEPYA